MLNIKQAKSKWNLGTWCTDIKKKKNMLNYSTVPKQFPNDIKRISSFRKSAEISLLSKNSLEKDGGKSRNQYHEKSLIG